MPQLRHISRSLRAAIAIIAAWALMFGMSASGAAAAGASDVVLEKSGSASSGLFACFKRHMTQRADPAGERTTQGGGSAKHQCPCCLAAHTATAVLPNRLATTATPLRAPVRIGPPAAAAREPESFVFHSAHGARAPPV